MNYGLRDLAASHIGDVTTPTTAIYTSGEALNGLTGNNKAIVIPVCKWVWGN